MARTSCPSKKNGPRLHCSFTKPPCKILESSPPPDGRTCQLWSSNSPAQQFGGFHAKSSCFTAEPSEQAKFQYPCISRSGAATPLPESRLGCSICSPHWPEGRDFRIPGLLIKSRNHMSSHMYAPTSQNRGFTSLLHVWLRIRDQSVTFVKIDTNECPNIFVSTKLHE